MSIRILQLRDLTIYMYGHFGDLLELARGSGHAFRPSNPRWRRYKRGLPRGAGRGAAPHNVRAGLQALGVASPTGLTEFGQRLYQRRRNQELLKVELGREILLRSGGWAFCHALDVCGGQGRSAIWEFYKEQYDPDMPEHYMNISDFNHFLVWLGVSTPDYRFNRRRFEQITGLGTHDINGLQALSSGARACFRALVALGPGWKSGRMIRSTAEQQGGDRISVHGMHSIARELSNEGLIRYRHRARGIMQRGQHGEWKLRSNGVTRSISEAFLSQLFSIAVNWDLAEALSKPFSRLVREMGSRKPDLRGRALEQFVAKICWKLGIRNLRFRSRDVIRGMEVDLVGEKTYPTYQRYLVQCKNRSRGPVGPPVISKELGISVVRSIDNLIIASTTGFVEETRAYMHDVIEKTGRNVFLLGDRDIAAISTDENNLFEIIERENRYNMNVRGGEDSYWLKIELSHLLPSRIEVFGWGPDDAKAAWLKLLEEGALKAKPSLSTFETVYRQIVH